MTLITKLDLLSQSVVIRSVMIVRTRALQVFASLVVEWPWVGLCAARCCSTRVPRPSWTLTHYYMANPTSLMYIILYMNIISISNNAIQMQTFSIFASLSEKNPIMVQPYSSSAEKKVLNWTYKFSIIIKYRFAVLN